MPRSLLLQNCRPYDAPAGAAPVDLRIRDGAIAAVGADARAEAAAPEPVLDAGGRLLIPGLVDLHLHGAGGADLIDGTPEALRTMSAALARMGTTTFLGTTLAHPAIANRHLEVAAARVGSALGGARLAGLYLEGPFVNPAKRGGIPPQSVRPYSAAALEEILALAGGTLRMMTVAPELPGGLELIERLVAAGVTPSFGHSEASYEQTRAGLAAGIRHATHLFNAMQGLHHRAPGPLVALLEADGVPVELISDGVHLDPHVVRFAARVFGRERCVLITDSMRTAGLPDGRYEFAGRELQARDGAVRYPDGTLAGTSLSLLEVALRFHGYSGCSLAEAVDCASRLPARILGLESCTGSLEVGKQADLVLLDADRSVWATLVEGAVVYRK